MAFPEISGSTHPLQHKIQGELVLGYAYHFAQSFDEYSWDKVSDDL